MFCSLYHLTWRGCFYRQSWYMTTALKNSLLLLHCHSAQKRKYLFDYSARKSMPHSNRTFFTSLATASVLNTRYNCFYVRSHRKLLTINISRQLYNNKYLSLLILFCPSYFMSWLFASWLYNGTECAVVVRP